MVDHFGVYQFVAVVVGFVMANAFHYVLARVWIFHESMRGIVSGYFYFLSNALFGLVVILVGFALLTDGLGLPYLPARVVASLCAGTLVFMLNATLNFRQL